MSDKWNPSNDPVFQRVLQEMLSRFGIYDRALFRRIIELDGERLADFHELVCRTATTPARSEITTEEDYIERLRELGWRDGEEPTPEALEYLVDQNRQVRQKLRENVRNAIEAFF